MRLDEACETLVMRLSHPKILSRVVFFLDRPNALVGASGRPEVGQVLENFEITELQPAHIRQKLG